MRLFTYPSMELTLSPSLHVPVVDTLRHVPGQDSLTAFARRRHHSHQCFGDLQNCVMRTKEHRNMQRSLGNLAKILLYIWDSPQ